MRVARIAWALPLLTAAGVHIVACSHDIVSPAPTGQRAEPDLVCNAKPVSGPFATVAIHGANMTPMPSKTLEGARELRLPSIVLEMVTPLGGATKVDDPIAILDDPAKPAESRVHWTSEELLSFDVRPEDKLPAGVMTIEVTNPDASSKTTIEKGLAIVPEPAVAKVDPRAICDDQSDQTVTITGTNFLSFDGSSPTVTVGEVGSQHTYQGTVDPKSCTDVSANLTEQNVKLCTSLSFTIKKGDFPVAVTTQVPVVVTNPKPADCASSEVIMLTIEPPPKVDSVVPATVCSGGSQLTVTGSGFEAGAKVTLDCAGTRVDSIGVTVASDGKSLIATFGAGAMAGASCDVIVTNLDGCEDRPLPHKTVSATTGPILFYADPGVIYNGINTRVTLYATSITPPLPADAVTITLNGAATPGTKLAFNTVAAHPNRLQAIVPKDQAPGVYDVTLKDNSGCFATLPKAFTVTKDLTVTLKNVVPPFGWTGEDTAVTVFRDATAAAPANKPFVDRPRMFLNPTSPAATDVAVEVESVSFVDADRVTGVVPKGTPAHGYDLVVVNPDGSVAVKSNAYTETANAPPIIGTVTPSSIAASSGQVVVVSGTSFSATDTISLTCVSSSGASVASPSLTKVAPTCTGTGCTQSVTIDGSVLAAGDVCVLRVANPDGTYADYSAIGVTTPSLNLNSPKAGPNLNFGRRALSASAGNATPAARFVFALGGDDGTAASARSDYEFASVDPFGTIGAWTVSPVALSSKRTLSGVATVGRYIYLVGGDDGTGPVNTAERALILSPRESPVITDVDLSLGAAGLAQGAWHYRVSAMFDAADTDNPGGESLASDEFSIRLPAFPGKKIAVTLVWRAPVDVLGAPIAGVTGYRIYRSTAADDKSGSETLLATVGASAPLNFVDDGTKTPAAGAAKPLPLGATGAWAKLPNLATKRSGAGVAAAFDPSNPAKLYVYAAYGKTAATTATGTYEFLPVTLAANGRQTAAATWTAGAQTSATPRWQLGTWLVNGSVTSLAAADSWIYLGGGLDGSDTTVGKVEAGKVTAGGQLASIDDGPKDFSSTSAGYGVCAANDQLFVFGGQGGAPSSGAKSAKFVSPLPGLANNSWNSEGLTLTHGRYLMGSAVQSAFIFLLGGKTDEPSNASKTTELVIW
jgi:hypothetical protein